MVYGAIKKALVRRGRKTIGAVRSKFGLAYASQLGEADVFEMLRGRAVALVGNAASLSDTRFGTEIDGHDIVLRLNAAPLPSAASHGARTTIIATSIVIELELVRMRGAEHVFFMSPRPKYLPGWLVSRPDFFLYPVASHADLMKRVGARPTTGMMVIDLLSRSPCAAIDLYGFDFFQSGSLSNAKPRRSEPHDFGAERQIVLDLMRHDGRFRLHSAAGDSG